MGNKRQINDAAPTISQLKDGRYRLRVYMGRKTITDKKTGELKKVNNTKDFNGKSEEEVKEKYSEWIEKVNSSHDYIYEEKLLMECVYDWLHKVKSISLKPISYARLIQVTDTYVNPCFNIYKLNEIEPDIIQERLVNNLYQRGFSYSTIKKAFNILTGYYKWAVSANKVAFNPTLGVILPSEKLIKQTKGQTDEVKYYTKSEIKKIKKAADATNNSCYEVNNYRYPRAYVYLFIMQTGLRIGEMLALKWDDYDPEKKTIKITKDVIEYTDPQSKKTVTLLQNTPKTNSSRRTLTLSDSAVEILETIKERSFNPNNPFIVANRNKNKKRQGAKEYVAPSNFRNAFKRFCQFAEVEYKGVHALRHTFATMMFDKGVDVKYISSWLGHSSVQVTYDIYIHIMEECGYEGKNEIPAIDF